jgi:RNA polymerase sigma-70 factor (ECF subfamily)
LFAVIFDRHFDAVHAYLLRRVGADRADDLASATFTIAFERRGSFRAATSSARPWLFGIATNLLRNEWRAQQRALEALSHLASRGGDVGGGPEIDRAGQSVSEAERVAELLVDLDGDQRDVLLLYAWEGFSYQEIAAALGVPVGTVRSRLARGRARLRSLLRGERSAAALNGDRQETSE